MDFSDYIKQDGVLGTWVPSQTVNGVVVPGHHLITWTVIPGGETDLVYKRFDGEPLFSFDSQDSTALLSAAEGALQDLEALINVKFQYVPYGSAIPYLAFVDATNISDPAWDFRAGSSGPPGSINEGMVVLRKFEGLDFDDGSIEKSILLHEIGHVLGLDHPHDSGDGSGASLPGLSFPEDPGPDGLNHVSNTVMSYNRDGGVYPNTFMPVDIEALTSKYGVAPDAAANVADVFNLSDTSGFFSILWDSVQYDGSGNLIRDKIVNDVAAQSVIDLRAATDEVAAGGGGYTSGNLGNFQNAGGYHIAVGTVIEDADGNSDIDFLIGNEVGNVLRGFSGDDIILGHGGADEIYGGADDDDITGGAGNDTIDGGAGIDKAFYSGNIADYGIGIVGDKVVLTDTVANRDGVDTLTGIEELFFDDGSIIVANLPKAPTSFQVSHVPAHTYTGMVSGPQSYAAWLTNVVDPDGGTNRMEIDASRTDAAILPYLVISSSGMLSFNGIAPSGTFDIGLRTYDAANNVRSETQVIALEVQENTAPVGVTWNPNGPTPGTIAENPDLNAIVGYLRISDPNGHLAGSSGENYSIRLIGDYSSTYAVIDDGDFVYGSHEHYHYVRVIDPGNVDYERDAMPELTVEITDVAGNVSVFTLQVTVQDTDGFSWSTSAGTATQTRSVNGGGGDDILNASASLGSYIINGGAGGDTINGGKGSDNIDGGVGNDIMRGNAGIDHFKSYSGSDTIYGGTGNDSVDLSPFLRPTNIDDAYMSGGFLVIERDDTVVKIYQDVEQITMGVPWVGNFSWTRAEFLAEFQGL